MNASHPDQAAPDTVAAELAPDLAAIIGHLLTGAGDAGQPAVLTSVQAGALDRAHDTLAGFHEDALAWAAGAGPGPAWQSWANRLALALGELAGTLDPPPGPGGKPVTAWGGQVPGVVKVRLSGAPADLETVTALLAADAAVEVLTGPDGPYPNRRDAGARVYLTIGITATRGARPGVRARPVSGRVRTR